MGVCFFYLCLSSLARRKLAEITTTYKRQQFLGK